MGTSQAKAVQVASFKQPPPTAITKGGTYYAKDLDNYSKIRVIREGDIKSSKLDYELLKAVVDCVAGDGKVDAKELREVILPKVADGRGKPELTCNERWTLRFAIGEFGWDFDARQILLNEMCSMHVLDAADKEVTDPEARKAVVLGPSLESLQQPAEKRAKGAAENLVYVDGMMLDRDMLLAAKEATSDDGVIDACEAVKIFQAAHDEDAVLTRCERWTFRYILTCNVFTDAAFNFLKEALSKMSQSDDNSAN